MNKFIITTSLTALLSGCVSVGPDYKAPENDQAYKIDDLTQKDGKAISAENLGLWWEQFNDKTLNELIKNSLADSYTMQSAQAKVLQARALLGVSRADYYPTLDAKGSVTRGRHLSNSRGGNGADNLYSTGFDARWEIDIFGGNRRNVEAASADLQASELNLQNVWVTLASEIATNYIALRGYQQQLLVAQNNLKAQEATLEILESRYKSGLTNKLDVQQARYNMERTRSTLPPLRVLIEESLNSLAVLVGKMPGELQASLSKVEEIPDLPVKSINSIPADIIRQRPDVRQAERRLAAETARIGVAKSDLYPKFFINGSIGLEALHTENFFNNTNRYNYFGPGFSWNLFSAGAVRNRTKAQTAVADAARADYNNTLVSAVKEVRDALISHSQEQLRFDALLDAVEAAELAEQIAQDQYKNGLTDFNNVLDAQRSLFELQARLTESEAKITVNMVRVYKALGGGWQNLK